MCNTNSKEWEARLEKGLRMWRHLQSKAQPIEEWVTAAEAVMTQDGDNTDDLLTNHKVSAFTLKENKVMTLTLQIRCDVGMM